MTSAQPPYPARKVWTEKHRVTLSLGNPAAHAVPQRGRQKINSINPVNLSCYPDEVHGDRRLIAWLARTWRCARTGRLP